MEKFATITELTAKSVEFEYNIKKVLDYLPSEKLLNDKFGADDKKDELKEKLKTREDLVMAVVDQVKKSKDFRQTIVSTFTALDTTSTNLGSLWSGLSSGHFSDKIIAAYKEPLEDLLQEQKGIEKMIDELTLVNKADMDKLEEDIRAVYRGGSEELKTAMKILLDLSKDSREHDIEQIKLKAKYENTKTNDENVR